MQTATAVIAACTQDYFVSMLTADVNVTALERLSRCDYSTAPPPCLAEVVARVDDPEVAAASRAADPAATEGDLTCEKQRWRRVARGSWAGIGEERDRGVPCFRCRAKG